MTAPQITEKLYRTFTLPELYRHRSNLEAMLGNVGAIRGQLIQQSLDITQNEINLRKYYATRALS
ncbi:MAG: hypothetical protein AAF661_15025 [Pseudomonadota bacterium]